MSAPHADSGHDTVPLTDPDAQDDEVAERSLRRAADSTGAGAPHEANAHPRPRPSSAGTRLVYGAALLLAAMPLVVEARLALRLVNQSGNPNIVNALVAAIAIVVAIAAAIAVGHRLHGLVRGQCRLEVIATGGLPHAMRRFGLLLMCAGLLAVAGGLAARSTSGVGAVVMIVTQFYPLLGLGFVFFEAGRLLERETLPAPAPARADRRGGAERDALGRKR